jgi:hypothetical protein
VYCRNYFICRLIGKYFFLLWQHCRRPWSFTCKPCSFGSGRAGFIWVRRVWNGSANPKPLQMRGAFRHTISQRKIWTSSGNSQTNCSVYCNVRNRQNMTKWCLEFSEGRTDVQDEQRSGRSSLISEDLLQEIEGEIRANRCVTLKESCITSFPKCVRS